MLISHSPQVLGGGLAVEQRPLERRVVPGDHRKAVERQDVSALHAAAGGPVVGAVGIDARLEPHPGVAQFGVREGARDLADHRVRPCDRHLVFGHTLGDRGADGLAAEVTDACACLISSISSADLTIRSRMVAAATSKGCISGSAAVIRSQQIGIDVVLLDAEPTAG